MRLEKLSTTGPALSSLLKEVCAFQGSSEGLILGRYNVVRVTIVNDSHDPRVEEQLHGQVTRFCCSHGIGAFYDPAGQIKAECVQDLGLKKDECILGWFTHQPPPRRGLSARERTVTAGLAAFVPNDKPVLMCVIWTDMEHGGATLNFEQQIYEQEVGGLTLRPTELTIDNLTAMNRQRDYSRMHDSYAVPSIPLTSRQSNEAGSAAVRAAQMALYEQPQALERACEDLLTQMEKGLRSSGSQLSDLRHLQQEVGHLVSPGKRL